MSVSRPARVQSKSARRLARPAGRDAELPTDGRALRSHHSRDAIVGALFDLIGDGTPEPTAQQVAERAAVGLRSVFRHFSDMESLYATLDTRLLAELLPMLDVEPPAGSPSERALALVDQRAAVFEHIMPYKRAANLSRARSPFLSARHRKLVSELRTRLLRWLPELRDAPPEMVDALEQATSFEAWDRLRNEQRLGRPRARAAMACAVTTLVGALARRS